MRNWPPRWGGRTYVFVRNDFEYGAGEAAGRGSASS
jgi:hypothetical protein